MTAPDPAQLAAPVDPAAYGRRTRLFGPAFWLVIGFAVICILAGAWIGIAGPRFFKPSPGPAPASAPAPAPSSIDARLSDIQARLAEQDAHAGQAEPSASTELDALTQRVKRLEDDRLRVSLAAAQAVAAASLSEASSGSRPFAGELAIITGSTGETPELRALRPLAETGAPTLAALAAEFPDAAAKAAVASRARARGTGFFAVVAQAFAAILTIRRVDKLDGKGVDAVLARVGRQVEDGNLGGAVAELKALPPAGQDAIQPWLQRAQRRVEIDRRVAAIRAQALADLTRAARGGAVE